jgi:DNA (cytosine-5)-methyltransferase 1
MRGKKSKPTLLDLFAGAGGLSIGFEEAGFEVIGATDFDKWSCDTLRINHPDAAIIEGDITDLSSKELMKALGGKQVDVIVGGPPCQGFSQLGKRIANDPRNKLLYEFFRVVTDLRPKVFVMENVPQLLKSDQYAEFKELVASSEYEIVEKVLLAADYGAPQKRQRAIIIGSRIGTPSHPAPTHRNPQNPLDLFDANLEVWKTVKDAIGDLPLKPTGVDLHVGRNPTELSKQRYSHIPVGGNRFNLPKELTPNCWLNKPTGLTDVFGRLWWDRPSVTIRTEFFKPEKGRYLHPTEDRPITLREAARIQGFPDSYKFTGSYTQIAKQIGNAVPTALAESIAEQVLSILESPVTEAAESKESARLPLILSELAA